MSRHLFFSGNKAKWYAESRCSDLRYAMSEITRQLGRRKVSKHDGRASCSLFLPISLLLLFGLAGSYTAKAAENQSGLASSAGPGAQFAIADFDGDFRPDLASVQAGQTTAGTSSYWIQLRLSAVGRQSIQIAGPSGGLSIEARDVNGDHAVDLVLTTAWFRQPVAILLNDGHGGFSRVEPTAFPGAFSESKTNWASCSNPTTGAVGLPAQSRTGLCPETRTLLSIKSHADSILLSGARLPLNPYQISHAGRAPPLEVPLF
jgi:hypothetical protein